MNKYAIDYLSTTDHDMCHVWVKAYSEEDAIYEAQREYWDIEEIICCREIS